MPRTPENLRGVFYPSADLAGCQDWDFCQATSLCANFSPHRQKCLGCKLGIPTDTVDEATEDADLKRIAYCMKTTDAHRRTAAALEQMQQATVVNPGEQQLQEMDSDPAMTARMAEYEAAYGSMARAAMQ